MQQLRNFLRDKLNNEAVAFIQFVCFSHSMHHSDILSPWTSSTLSCSLMHLAGYLQKLVYSVFLPHISSPVHPVLLPLSWLRMYYPSSRHAQQLQSCILKEYLVSLHEALSLIWIEAAAGLTHKPCLVNPCSSCNGTKGRGSWQCCDKLHFSYFFIQLIYSFPFHCHPAIPLTHIHTSATPWSGFPSRSLLWSGKPISVIMREVNWPCCAFRRLENDGGNERMK